MAKSKFFSSPHLLISSHLIGFLGVVLVGGIALRAVKESKMLLSNIKAPPALAAGGMITDAMAGVAKRILLTHSNYMRGGSTNMAEERAVTSQELSGLAEFRSKIYGLLSSVYIQNPIYDFVKRILDKEVSSFLSTLSPDIGLNQEMEEGLEVLQRFIGASKGQEVEDVHQSLSVEYTRLFRGIKPSYSPPPPYESVYRDEERVLMGKSAVEVLRKYSKAGVGVPPEYKEPPDYIALELDFMRFLAEKEGESWKKDKLSKALRYVNMEFEFLEEHITQWVPEFCNNVVDMAELDFYRGIAKITKGFITDDHQRIEGFIDILRQS